MKRLKLTKRNIEILFARFMSGLLRVSITALATVVLLHMLGII